MNKTKNRKIFITGASGSLGQRLSQILLEKGDNITGFDISPPPDILRSYNNFNYIQGDVANFDKLYNSINNIDIAIHCAALLPNKNYLGSEVYFKVNSMGAVNFLKACHLRNVNKAVIINNTGVLEPSRNGAINDSDNYRERSSPYIESKIVAEKMIDTLNLKDKISYIILRSSAIYGFGMYYRWNEIFKMAKRGRLFVISSGDALYSVIHIDDLVDAIQTAIDRLDKKISGQKITITSNEKLSIYEILRCITNYYSARPPIKIPFIPAYIGAGILWGISRAFKNNFLSTITPETILDYKNGLFFDNSKAKELLGFQAKRIFKDEIVKVLNEYDKQKSTH